jgi:putative ABC transport system substrate-binding protein
MLGDENDPVYKTRLSAFTQALGDLGWADGRNLRMGLRWGGDDINRMRALAQELVGLQPDIIVTNGTAATAALQRETRTIPIVFAGVGDPVVSGIVPRLDRPSGNITGFCQFGRPCPPCPVATIGATTAIVKDSVAPRVRTRACRQPAST